MRRLAPRHLSNALERVVPDVAPATLIAAVQGAWPEVAGPGLAAAAAPTSERDGTVTISCESSVWAHELELLGPDLLERLNAALGAAPATPSEAPRGTPRGTRSGAPRVAKLRFVVGSPPNRS